MFNFQELMSHVQRRFGDATNPKTRKVHGKVMGHIAKTILVVGDVVPSTTTTVTLNAANPSIEAATGNRAFPFTQLHNGAVDVSYDINGAHGAYHSTTTFIRVSISPSVVYDLNPEVNPSITSPHVPTGTGLVSTTINVGAMAFRKGTPKVVVFSLKVTPTSPGGGLGSGGYNYTWVFSQKPGDYVPRNSEFIGLTWTGSSLSSVPYGTQTSGTYTSPAPVLLDPGLAGASLDADMLDGLHARMEDVDTASPYVPIADGEANPNLDADTLDGKHGNAFALRQDATGANDITSYVKKADYAVNAGKLNDKESTEFMEVTNYSSGTPLTNDKRIDYTHIKNVPATLKQQTFLLTIHDSVGDYHAGYLDYILSTPSAGMRGGSATPDDKPIVIVLRGAENGGISYDRIVDVKLAMQPLADNQSPTMNGLGVQYGVRQDRLVAEVREIHVTGDDIALLEQGLNVFLDNGQRLAEMVSPSAGNLCRADTVGHMLNNIKWRGYRSHKQVHIGTLFQNSIPMGMGHSITLSNGYVWTGNEAVLYLPTNVWLDTDMKPDHWSDDNGAQICVSVTYY